MDKPHLTLERLRELLDYDPFTGLFTHRRLGRSGVKAGSVAGHRRKDGYISIRIDGYPYLAHRLAWLYVHGKWPELDIDHIDGAPSNNAIANLRDVSRGVNLHNVVAPFAHSKTGVLGVSKRQNRFFARIIIDGKNIRLGNFATQDEAEARFLAFKASMHLNSSRSK